MTDGIFVALALPIGDYPRIVAAYRPTGSGTPGRMCIQPANYGVVIARVVPYIAPYPILVRDCGPMVRNVAVPE